MNIIRILWVALALTALQGCASTSELSALKKTDGYDRRVNINDIRSMRQMDRTPVEDIALIEYMQRIRQRLEAAHGAPCDCVVVVDSSAGYEAYSLSSYTVVLSSGLVAQASSEDEIAAVIAHELAHVYEGHNLTGWMQTASVNLLKAGTWAAGAGGYTLLFGETINDLSKGVVYNRWNAEHEVKADKYAAAVLPKAGYSLNGLKMAVRKLSAYGKNAQSTREEAIGDCVTRSGDRFKLRLNACTKQITGSETSVYADPQERIKAIMMVTSETDPEARRRRVGAPPPRFDSVDYLFSLNTLVADDKAALVAALNRMERKELPESLHGNVAVTNKLAMAYAIAGDTKNASENLKKSLSSEGRTAWTFNHLYQAVDRSGESSAVADAITDAYVEIGFMPMLLPIENYLAKRHGLMALEAMTFGRCVTNLVDDLNTYNRCVEFAKYASGGRSDW